MRTYRTILGFFGILCLTIGLACTGGGKDTPPPPAPKAPTITTNPANATVTAGQTATFTMAATGDATLAYQWKENGANATGTSTNPSYTTPVTTSGMNGHTFTCTVTNSVGSATSTAATLTVNSLSILTNPANATVNDGGQVTFSVSWDAYPNATGDVLLQWQRAESLGSAFGDITGMTSPSILVQAISYTGNNGAQYRCKFVHTTGTYYSTAATLTVAALPIIITTNPIDVTVQAGQPFSFTTVYTGTQATGFQWQLLDLALSSSWLNIQGATNQTFSGTASNGMNGDQYRCIITNPFGFVTTNAATLTVTPAPTAPVFTTQPADQTVHANQSATFTLAASGNPTPTYQWKKNGTDISGATSNSYTWANAQLSDDGTKLTCVATNSVTSTTSNEATLHVTPALVAPSFTMQPSSQTLTVGDTFTITTTANGNPTPSGALQELISSTWTTLSTGFSYTLNNAQLSDSSRQFRFQATNSEGTATSNVATLTVNAANSAPTIDSLIANPNPATIGDESLLTGTTSDIDGDTVTWTLSIDPSSTATGTFLGPTSGTGNISSRIECNSIGTLVIRCTATDGHGGTATPRTVSIPVT